LVEANLKYDGVDYPDLRSVNQDQSFKIPLPADNPLFALVISYTHTSLIPGITAAGQNEKLLKYTSPADAEFLNYGHCKCLDSVPVTPDGMPTPAIITKTALDLSNMPFLVINAGSIVEPQIPYISFDMNPGNDIRTGNAVDESYVKKGLEYGEAFGRELAKLSKMVVIGESIPGGTTTALGVLVALGINAWSKVSSSLTKNPHTLKNKVVNEGMAKAGIPFGCFKNDPVRAIAAVGDPMIPVVTGLACGINGYGSNVMLAGGTQMTAVIAAIRAMNRSIGNICIGTTCYVANDPYSDIQGIANEICSDFPIHAADLHFEDSERPGLKAFANGFVKDGAGAGGVSILAMLKSRGSLTGTSILRSIEIEYDKLMLKQQKI
jgi:uncharacterized protein (TIGR00303 family)